MAVSFTSATASSGKNGTASSFTFTSYAVSGTNPAVLVKIVLLSPVGANVTVTNVAASAGLTAASIAEVKALQADGGPAEGTFVSIWKVVAPSGTGTITVTLSGSTPYQAVAELWANCDQTDPAPAADAVATTTITNPLTVTPTNLTANDAASGMAGNGNTGDGPDFDQTETYKDNTTNVNASGGYHLGTGAVSCTWGSPAGCDVLVGVRLVVAETVIVPTLPWLPQTHVVRGRLLNTIPSGFDPGTGIS